MKINLFFILIFFFCQVNGQETNEYLDLFWEAQKKASFDIDGAINDYNKLIKSKPLFWTAYEYRGKCKQTKSDFAGAIHDYSQYINGREYEISYDSTMLASNVNLKNEIDAKNRMLGAIYYNRGFCKYKLLDYRSAIDDFTKAILLSESDHSSNGIVHEAYCCRGVCKEELGNDKGALNDYNSSIKVSPLYCKAFFFRGYLRNKMKLNIEACKDLSRSGELGCSEAYDVIKDICR
jgi:tetratricopeptide (TPR) repeat protein